MANKWLIRGMNIRWRDQVKEVTKRRMDRDTRAAIEERRTVHWNQDPCLWNTDIGDRYFLLFHIFIQFPSITLAAHLWQHRKSKALNIPYIWQTVTQDNPSVSYTFWDTSQSVAPIYMGCGHLDTVTGTPRTRTVIWMGAMQENINPSAWSDEHCSS